MDTIKTASDPTNKKPELFINRDFAYLWCGQAISKLGDVVFNSTLVFWIATSIAQNQSWAPLAVSGVSLGIAHTKVVSDLLWVC